MAQGVNKVILVGHLGRDPEVRTTQSGMTVANFTLATTEKFKNEEKTEWHRIVTFGKLAEICGQYLTKGKLVFIEGRLQTKDWEDKEGVKRSTTEVVANEMKMLGGKGDSAGAGAGSWTPKAQAKPAQGGYSQPSGPAGADMYGPGPAPMDDDDIPF